MEFFILSLVAAWAITRYSVTDLVAMTRGTESPRHRERRERDQRRHERAMARPGPTIGEALAGRIAGRVAEPRAPRARDGRPAGPAREYARALWRDAWADAGERHDRAHARRADRREARERQRAAGEGPSQRARAWAAGVGAWAADRWSGRARPAEPAPASRVESQRVCPAFHQPPESVHCRDCDTCTPGPDCVAGRCVQAHDPDEDDQTDDTPEAAPPPVTPIRKDHDMTPTSSPAPVGPSVTGVGEIISPEAGLAFCEAMRSQIMQMRAEIDGAVGTGTESGVKGDLITTMESLGDSLDGDLAALDEVRAAFLNHQDIADHAQSDATVGGGRYLGIGA